MRSVRSVKRASTHSAARSRWPLPARSLALTRACPHPPARACPSPPVRLPLPALALTRPFALALTRACPHTPHDASSGFITVAGMDKGVYFPLSEFRNTAHTLAEGDPVSAQLPRSAPRDALSLAHRARPFVPCGAGAVSAAGRVHVQRQRAKPSGGGRHCPRRAHDCAGRSGLSHSPRPGLCAGVVVRHAHAIGAACSPTSRKSRRRA